MSMSDQTPVQPKKSNTGLIIAVVVILLCCCCVIVLGLGWNFGDSLVKMLGM